MSDLKGTLTALEVINGTLSLGVEYFKGDKGESGVYVGENEPDSPDFNVWINPTGEVEDYITRDELNEALKDAGVEIDLTPYAKMADLATVATSGDYNDLINKPEGLATEEYVDDKVSSIEIPDVDLTGMATEEYVDNAISAIELIPGPPGKDGEDGKNYVLTEDDKAEIAGMVPGADVDLSDYYTKEEIDGLLSNLPVGDIPSGEEVKW